MGGIKYFEEKIHVAEREMRKCKNSFPAVRIGDSDLCPRNEVTRKCECLSSARMDPGRMSKGYN
jgi:hypothetical protein